MPRGRAPLGRSIHHATRYHGIVERGRHHRLGDAGGFGGHGHGDSARRGACDSRGDTGRDVVRRAAFIGAHLNQALRNVDHILLWAGRDGECRAFDDGGQKRCFHAEMRRFAVIHLEQNRAQILQNARHGVVGIRRNGHATIRRHDNVLRAVFQGRATVGARGYASALAQVLV